MGHTDKPTGFWHPPGLRDWLGDVSYDFGWSNQVEVLAGAP